MLFRGVIERLKALLRGELAAVAGYQRALGAMREKAASDGEHLLRLASDHQRTVTALQGTVQARGGDPPLGAGPWEGLGADELTADGAVVRLESRSFVAALLAVETRGLARYETALGLLDEDAHDLVEFELIPRQRRHVADLSALLSRLAV